jgi:hypothetical protein
LLFKELEIQKEDLKNQIDSLIKEKEDLTIELERCLLMKRDEICRVPDSERINELEKLVKDKEIKYLDEKNNRMGLHESLKELKKCLAVVTVPL